LVADREEKLIEPNQLIRELLARIRAILRRKVDGTASPVFSIGAVQLEPSTRNRFCHNASSGAGM
jgi:DNA-binding response OmpR family regulator